MFHGNPSKLYSTKKKGYKYVIFDLKHEEEKETEDNQGNQTKKGNSNSNSSNRQKSIVNKAALIMEYESSPFYDLYQFGRAIHSTNDFILPGYLHINEEGIYTGPISRYSFHILCERLSPFRSFIFAGGFNEASESRVWGDYYPFSSLAAKEENSEDSEDEEESEEGKIIDGFTKYGIKIFQPTIGEWLELSVLGNTYDSYSSPSSSSSSSSSSSLASPSSFVPHSCNLANQLVDGTLLDVGGVLLMFQDPITMMKSLYSSSLSDHPSNIVKQLNDLKAHCPVLFNEIEFYYLNEQEKYQIIRKKVEMDDIFPLAYHSGPIHIPTSTFSSTLSVGSPSSSFSSMSSIVDNHIFPGPSHIAEDHRSFVFPYCGHVFAYHKSLEEKACPLCRQHGPFVPLSIAFEPTFSMSPSSFSSNPPFSYPSCSLSISSSLASSDSDFYVFNPCGHTSSFELCSYWGNLSIFPKRRSSSSSSVSSPVVNQSFPQEIIAICPFCGCELCSEKPFTKLILQSTASGCQSSVRNNRSEKDSIDSRNQTSPGYSSRIRLDWKNKVFQNLLFSSQKQMFQHESDNSCSPSFSYPSYAPHVSSE
jgi:hypothetical protein